MTTRRPDAPSNMMQDDDAPPASGLSSMQRAILTIQKMRTKIESLERARVEPIAIIGMGCRFPGGASTPEAFFRILVEGVDAVTEVPPERWAIAAEEHSTDPEARAVRFGAFLRDVDLFDAGFFGISPREASKMDPQQRLLLEVTWEALERAGQLPERLVNSRTGVFLGVMTNDYAELSALAGIETEDVYTTTGNGHCFPAGRLSYTFGFQGPSVAVDTACSSSLVALHLACQSLRAGECNMAVAGGVNLMLVPSTTRKFAKTSALSPDGRCKTFDATANGFVRGEGCGMLVLKRLSDAERDGDTVLALIRGSAVNQDGRSTGLTTPNVLAQQAMLKQALENARVAPSDIGYVEAHGTGTPLGDPIEVEALKTVLGGPREKGSSCVLGAVKTNIGHLEAAAGVAGVMKVVLALQSELIPGNLHFRALNPRIDFRGTTLEIARAATPWKSGMRPRFAGVSAFGLSGTNAHVVLEEAPRNLEEIISKEASAFILPISAKTPEVLVSHAKAYQAMLRSQESPRLLDIIHTASSRRSHFEHRLSVVGGTKEELAASLESYLRGEAPSSVTQGKATPARAKVVFVFSGQGSQWVGMGKKLYDEESSFRSVIDSCDALLMGRLGWSLLDELEAPESMSRINETQVAQPLIFAIQIALVELLRSWGIAPDAVIGHSVGEIAAAHIAGILSLDEAIRLVAIRGRIMQKATGLGKMVSVAAPLAAARAAIAGHEERLSIAAVNDPGSVVLAGDSSAVDEVVAKLERDGVSCRPLRVNYAFHSPQMDPLAAELVERLARVDARRATLAMYSTVLAECVDGKELDVRYWGRNLRDTVNLAGAVTSAIHDGYQLFLEIGPHPVLASNVQQCLAAKKADGIVTYTLRKNQDDRRALLTATGALYTRGCAVEWMRLFPAGGRCVALPTYPWRKERHWVPPSSSSYAAPSADVSTTNTHPLLGAGFELATDSSTHLWQRIVDAQSLGQIRDHVVGGDVVFPATGYVQMAIAAAAELHGSAGVLLEEVVFERMLSFPAAERKAVQFVATSGAGGASSFVISSRTVGSEPWMRHVAGKLRVADAVVVPTELHGEQLAALRERCVTEANVSEHHRLLEEMGLSYGPSFRVVHASWYGSSEFRTRLSAVEKADGGALRGVALLDGALQVCAAFALETKSVARGGTLVPASIARLWAGGPLPHEVWAAGRLRSSGSDGVVADIVLHDDGGAVLVAIEGVVLRRLEVGRGAARTWVDDSAYALEWRRVGRVEPAASRKSGPKGWIVFGDGGAVGAGLAALLRERGERVVRVSFGHRLEQTGDDGYVIDPSSVEDHIAVLRGAFGGGGFRGAVHLGSVDAAAWDATTEATLERDRAHGCESALFLAQALVRLGSRDTPRLWLVTRGAQVVESVVAPSVAQAAVWGLGRVIALEHPELECTRVDLDPAADPGASARVLLAEVTTADREDQIAHRGDERFVARLARRALSAAAEAPWLRGDASYLITGGLGGLGLSLAQWMVANGARHLVLVGRRAPGEAASVAIAAMQAAGAEVLVIEADVTRSEDVARLFSRIDEALPPLRGVVHAAAVLSDRTVLELRGDDFAKVTRPKVLGALHLHRATEKRQLDFFLLYSSVASLIGSPGQANYAAANASLDALAYARRAMGLSATSVQWGPFSDVGLAAANENRGVRLALRGLESHLPEEGHAALARVVASELPEVALMRFDLRRWLESQPQSASSPFWAELRAEKARAPGATSSKSSARRMIEEKPEAERLAAMEAHVRQRISAVLYIAPSEIDLEVSFTSLGMDSLTTLELRNQLESTLELKLPPTLLFTYANGAALARHLLGRIAPSNEEPPRHTEQPAEEPAEEAAPIADDDLLAAFDASMTSIKDEGIL